MAEICTVDAFSSAAFGGNPAAVCLLETEVSEAWMQSVAAELNLSETAFVRARPDGRFALRWFTPTVEVELCGHATLATAHFLAERTTYPSPYRFVTRSGELVARVVGGQVTMDFPAFEVEPIKPPEGLVEALGVVPGFVGESRGTVFCVLADAASVRGLRPDFAALGRLQHGSFIVTAVGDDPAQADFVSRFFAPRYGILEDPVTGSAHCSLGPYWAGVLGRVDLVGDQVSSRGGRVAVGVRGDRVELGGEAITIIRGDIDVPEA